MDALKVDTIEELHKAIGKFLQSDYSPQDLIMVYENARKIANSFRVVYSVLPKVPPYNNNPLDGLQDIWEWCDKSIKLVDDIVSDLDQQTINKIICQLKKLRGFADKALSSVNNELKNKIQNEFNTKIEKERKNLIEKKSKLKPTLSSPLVLEAEVNVDMVEIKSRETKKALQLYLSKDPTFNNRISQHDDKINKVLETLNKLIGSNTSTGKLLDIYCTLKGIPIQNQFNDVGYAYSPIDDWADVICNGCSRLYTNIDNVIKTFEEIQTKAGQKINKLYPQKKYYNEETKYVDKSDKKEQKVDRRAKAMCNQVFICYSHKDKRWLEDLQTHLKPYVRNDLITAWSDRKIAPGSKWLEEIEAALASSKVAVLLVTPNFLASDFIHEKELGPLLKKAETGKAMIIWIPVRACSYMETPLKDFQAAIDPEKPLANMKAERDKAWVRICEEIKKTREDLKDENTKEITQKTNVIKTRENSISEANKKTMEWDVFICHASEDKNDFVEPLAQSLKHKGLRVWYDEFSLRTGNSLRGAIDKGLSMSQYGLVVISPNFLKKDWPQKELDGLVSREVKGEKVILPIWHKIEVKEVSKYSPMLAGRKAISSTLSLKEIVKQLLDDMEVKIRRKVGIDTLHGEIWGGLTNLLEDNAFKLDRINSKITTESLNSIKTLIIATKGMKSNTKVNFEDYEIDAIYQFVNKGGCLLCVDQAWSWVYKKYGNKPLEQFPLNILGEKIGFCITGENINPPKHFSTEIMEGINSVEAKELDPSEIKFNGKDTQGFIMDDKDRIIAGFMPVGEGFVAVVGHRDLLIQNPEITVRILAYFAREKRWTLSR